MMQNAEIQHGPNEIQHPKPQQFQIKHLSLLRRLGLYEGAEIDHQHSSGLYALAKLIQIDHPRYKFHYVDYDNSKQEWSNYKTEPKRCVKKGSITARLVTRLTELKLDDFVNVNPIQKDPYIGWQCGKITNIDPNSGQVQVSYPSFVNGSRRWSNYFVHRNNAEEIREYRFTKVTKTKDYSSPEICKLTPDTIVTVEEIDGARCRISEPCRGWISFYSIEGKTRLKKISEDIVSNKVRRTCINNKDEDKVDTKASDVEYPHFWEDEAYYHDFDGDKLYNLVSDPVMVDDDYYNPKYIDIDLSSEYGQNIINQIKSLSSNYKTADFCKGDELHCRDRDGNWSRAKIVKHKLPNPPQSSARQVKNVRELGRLEAILVHFGGRKQEYDEWIFIKSNETICDCTNVCIEANGEHKIALLNTQSKWKYEVIKIESVKNKYLWEKYYQTKRTMIKTLGRDKVKEQYLWACSSKMSSDDIARQGFRKEYFDGVDCYKNIPEFMIKKGMNRLYFCRTLCGEYYQQSSKGYSLQNWPIKSDNQLYDVLVDNINKPNHYKFHDDSRIYPMFIVHINER